MIILVEFRVHIAICCVHPASRSAFPLSPAVPARLPTPLIVIRITGINSSLAGREHRNANRITPFIPSESPTGSSSAASFCASRVLARIQSATPAGAATVSARPAINMVRSSSERARICPIRGRRKGGISIKKALVSCRSTVLLRIPDVAITPRTPSATEPATINAAPARGKKRLPNRISVGNRPLQGTMALVRMANSRSRGESIIRQPVTPTALHPNPIHRVNACLPQPPQQHMGRSSRKAIRGR